MSFYLKRFCLLELLNIYNVLIGVTSKNFSTKLTSGKFQKMTSPTNGDYMHHYATDLPVKL
jgi:hypothetical protein